MVERRPDRIETRGAMLLAGLRRQHEFQTVHTTIARQWSEFRALGALPHRMGSQAYGAICGSSHTGFEYLSALEVSTFDAVPSHLGRMRVPAQSYAVFKYQGHVSGLEQCWTDIMQWLVESDYASAHAPDFECYDTGFDVATAQGDIEIWVSVVPKSGQPSSGDQ